MRSRRSLLSLTVLLLLACRPRVVVETPDAGPVPGASGDAVGDLVDARASLRDAARAYADALTARDPQAAATWVVPETFLFYEDLRLAALHGTQAQLENWNLLTLVMILELRVRMTAADLQALDGRGLFEHTIREGLAGEGVEALDLRDAWIADDGLHGEIRLEGETLLLLRRDAAEAGSRWRVDVPALIELLAPGFEALARERVSAEGKIAIALVFVELRVGAPVDPAIAHTPLQP